MKVLSRLASPAGFALVLLLFMVLPFLSVSCEVPGVGTAGVDYTGTNLVTGSEPEPEVPAEMTEITEGSEAGDLNEPAPDPGVQLLSIIAVVVIALGVGTVFVPRLKARLYGAAAAALVALVLAVVTLLVAQSTIESNLLSEAQDTGAAENAPGMPTMETIIGDMISSEAGFWLVAAGLALLALLNGGAALFGARLGTATAGPAPPPTGSLTGPGGLIATEAPTDPPGDAEQPPADPPPQGSTP